MAKVGDTMELCVTGTSVSGGVARLEGAAVFVSGALEGERVLAELVEVKRNYLRARTIEVLEASPERASPPCPVFSVCGGCALQHMAYQKTLEVKRRAVEDALRRVGGLADVPVRQTLGMAEPWHYRNNVQLGVRRIEGKTAVGFYAPGSREPVEADLCRIADPALPGFAAAAREFCDRYRLAYDPARPDAGVRAVALRTAQKGMARMAVLVSAGGAFGHEEELCGLLRRAVPQLVSVVRVDNPKRGGSVLDGRAVTLWGADFLEETVAGVKTRVYAQSFLQVNPEQAEALYSLALDFAALGAADTVFDLYCGAGALTIAAARRADRAVGVESNPHAVRAARHAARENRAANAEFLEARCEQALPRLVAEGARPDVLLVDPPYAGCARPVLEAAAAARPERIVYISCHPAALARDCRILAGLGYEVREAAPVDMFPWTESVECAALLTQKESP